MTQLGFPGRAVEAMTMLRAIGDRIDRHLLATEIRSMAGDERWLSPSCGHDSIGIHFSGNGTPDGCGRSVVLKSSNQNKLWLLLRLWVCGQRGSVVQAQPLASGQS
jgi:hypothetical protein